MLNSDYRDILSAFADAEVEYLLVGAHALAAHGHPRATGDIDLWVKPSAGNAARVMQALRQFGAPLGQVSREYFAQPDVVFQIGVAPRRIDVMTSVEAIAFEDAWPERLEVNLEGIPVPVIGRADFILLSERERAAGTSAFRRVIHRLPSRGSGETTCLPLGYTLMSYR